MKPLLWCLVCVIVLAVLAGCLRGLGTNVEGFGFYDNLWPSRDSYCENRGMKKSYMPQKCIILDKCGRIKFWDRYRNCRCVDKRTGLCLSCYPRVDPVMNAVNVYTDM